MKALTLAVLCALLLCGCATPTQDDLAKADIGPDPGDYETTIRQYLRQNLLDPTSAEVRIGFPSRGWWRSAPIAGGKVHACWIVYADINAKNSYGGYTGLKQWRFCFDHSELVRVLPPDLN